MADAEILVALVAAVGSAAALALTRADPRPALALAAAGLAAVSWLVLGVPVTATSAAGGPPDLFVESPYLRTVVLAWAGIGLATTITAVVGAGATRGTARSGAATLLAIAPAVVVLASGDAVVGAFGALVAGVVALLAGPRLRAQALVDAGRELRSVVVAAVAVVLGATGATLLATGAADFAAQDLAVTAPGLGLATLALGVGTALRFGAVPFHVRAAVAADAVPAAALPLVLGWAPLLLGVTALAVSDAWLVPLAATVEVERALVVLAGIAALLAAPLAASVQDDVGHVIAYVAVSGAGLVVLGVGALDPAAAPQVRTWVVVHAAAIAGLGTWLALATARFGTRRLAELDGWARQAPLLGVALIVVGVAVVGLPGWPGFAARSVIAAAAAGETAGAVLALAGALVVVPLARILAVGLRRPSAVVDGAVHELDGLGPARAAWGRARADVPAGAIARTRHAATLGRVVLRQNRVLLGSLLLVGTALLVVTVSAGGFDLAAAAAAPQPAILGGSAG